MYIDNKKKYIILFAIIALIITVSIGFAAFNANLNINNVNTNVSSDDASNFTNKVKFLENSLKCYKDGSTSNTVTPISNGTFSGTEWSDVVVDVNSSFSSLTCEVKIYNNSDYKAYYNKIINTSELECMYNKNASTEETNMCSNLSIIANVSFNTTASTLDTQYIINKNTIANSYKVPTCSGGTSCYIDKKEQATLLYTINNSVSNKNINTDIKVKLPNIKLIFATVAANY